MAFLAAPTLEFLLKLLEKRKSAAGGATPQLAAAGGAPAARLSGQSTPAARLTGAPATPALKDAKGRSMPPDVNRMVAQMKAGKEKE
jgi:hypothetical protein